MGALRVLLVLLLAADCASTPLHHRVEKREIAGTRYAIADLVPKPVEVLVTPRATAAGEGDLVVHFHGASFIPMQAAAESGRPLVVAVVQLGAGSSVYERPFSDPTVFPRLIAVLEARGVRIHRIYLTGFSAGYGAIRAILRSAADRIDGVMLLDGLHTGYTPDGELEAEKMEPFRRFAQEAANQAKTMIVTHSQILPPNYASTSETGEDLLRAIGIARMPRVRRFAGMQQLSEARCGGFVLYGFAGATAPDHIDQFHAYRWFLRELAR